MNGTPGSRPIFARPLSCGSSRSTTRCGSVGDGHALGAEALLRWSHPERGLVLPGEFIPICEETGLILPIGEWVLEAACAQLRAWESSPDTRTLKVSVNISAKQFRQDDFVDKVVRVLTKTG